MRFRSLCLSVLAACGLAACSSLPDPFTPYHRREPASAEGQVLSFDPNVRMKTEEESWPVAWAQLQPRRVIKP